MFFVTWRLILNETRKAYMGFYGSAFWLLLNAIHMTSRHTVSETCKVYMGFYGSAFLAVVKCHS